MHSSKLIGLVTVLLVGFGTTVLFQNCSGGNLPSNLDQTSAQQAGASYAELSLMVATEVTVNAKLGVMVVGGDGSYAFTLTPALGGVTGSLAEGFVYTAPADAGSVRLTVRDGLGMTSFKDIQIKAAVVVQNPTTPTQPTTPPQPATKAMYSSYWSGQDLHATIGSALITNYAREGQTYTILVSSASGSTPLYRCGRDLWGAIRIYFTSIDSACEPPSGGTSTLLGHIYVNQAAGTVPLYRHKRVETTDYYDSLDPNPPNIHYQQDRQLGFVLPP